MERYNPEDDEGGIILRIVFAAIFAILAAVAVTFAFLAVDHFLFPFISDIFTPTLKEQVGHAIGQSLGPNAQSNLFASVPRWVELCTVLFFIVGLILGPTGSGRILGRMFGTETTSDPLSTAVIWGAIIVLYFLVHLSRMQS